MLSREHLKGEAAIWTHRDPLCYAKSANCPFKDDTNVRPADHLVHDIRSPFRGLRRRKAWTVLCSEERMHTQ